LEFFYFASGVARGAAKAKIFVFEGLLEVVDRKNSKNICNP
jgi:hypothetical protein